ncbi:nucleotidyltransferase family protein [Rhodobacter sp. SGA-6-6]|uniref:NTP transferase domain-containing protein n=1 Tax=Rhodobacter sp. SGA-6-6 TaxID=2710882 RepID=UPI0013EE06F0|nr:nucleotidyltransferase family protein [Rhodobacter sp. SGA-6-6]
MSSASILILAAGASARMGGRDKLLEPVAGRPLLRLMAERALATGAPVLVVLPPDRPARAAALAGLALRSIIAEDAAEGMAASLRAGIAALPPDAPGAMILPADMPGITAEDMARMLDRWAGAPDTILRGADEQGREGHPVLFPADLFPALMALTGDRGARSVLAANRARLRTIALPGDHALLDIDTPEDWAAFRAGEGSGG